MGGPSPVRVLLSLAQAASHYSKAGLLPAFPQPKIVDAVVMA